MGELTEKEASPKPKEPKKLSKSEALEARVTELETKLLKIEQKQRLVAEGFEFGGNELRPLFGFGAVALVFDAISKKLAE
jgi:hypothetical protein